MYYVRWILQGQTNSILGVWNQRPNLSPHHPSEGGQIVCSNCLDFDYESPDSGEPQHTSRTWKRWFDPAGSNQPLHGSHKKAGGVYAEADPRPRVQFLNRVDTILVRGSVEVSNLMSKQLSFMSSLQGDLLHRTICTSNIQANVWQFWLKPSL